MKLRLVRAIGLLTAIFFLLPSFLGAVAPNETPSAAIRNSKGIDENYNIRLNSKAGLLTETERAYVAALPPVRVVSGQNQPPIDYFTKNGEYRGVSERLFREISADTGLRFTYMSEETPISAYQLVHAGKADILAGLYSRNGEFSPLEGVTAVSARLNIPHVIVCREGATPDFLQTLDQGKRALLSGQMLEAGAQNFTLVKLYDSTEQCMAAVQRGEADYFVVNAYAAEYHRKNSGFDELTLLNVKNFDWELGLGISQSADPMLAGIIEKAMHSFTDIQRQNIFFDSETPVAAQMTFNSFLRANALLLGLIALAILLLIFGIIFYFFRKRRLIESRFTQRYRMLASLTDEVLLEYDYDEDRLTLSGYTVSELGMEPVTLHFVRRLVGGDFRSFPDRIAATLLQMDQAGGTELEYQYDFNWNTEAGEQKWFHGAFFPVCDKNGRPNACMGKMRNIDQERVEKNHLLNLAQRDALTGLYNKNVMQEICDEYIHGIGRGQTQAFLIIDIDDFKIINDNYGHWSGDEMLKLIADIVRETFGAECLAGRIGGDEFVVFVKNISARESFHKKIEATLTRFREPVFVEARRIPLSCSIGVAFYPNHGTSYDDLYKCADIALYETKRCGKNGYRIFNEQMLLEKSDSPRSDGD